MSEGDRNHHTSRLPRNGHQETIRFAHHQQGLRGEKLEGLHTGGDGVDKLRPGRSCTGRRRESRDRRHRGSARQSVSHSIFHTRNVDGKDVELRQVAELSSLSRVERIRGLGHGLDHRLVVRAELEPRTLEEVGETADAPEGGTQFLVEGRPVQLRTGKFSAAEHTVCG